jgi:hypothetical protein
MSLEEMVTRGRISYISRIVHDLAQRRVTINFLKDPEENQINRILTFSDVEDFSEEEFEDEDVKNGIEVIESLIGLDEYTENETVRNVVRTELREMIFSTREKPQIEDVCLVWVRGKTK